MIFAIGDGSRVAAVSNYDHFPADVARLPRVGGLLDPSVERILAIKPDLVDRLRDAEGADRAARSRRHPVLQLPAQGAGGHHDDDPRDRRADRIGGARRRGRVADGTIARRDSREDRRPARIRRRCWSSSAIRRRCATSTRAAATASSTTCSRSPAAATCSRDVKQQAVQASTEMLIASRPDVIIELLYGDSLKNADVAKELRAWDALASVPAVRTHRDRRAHRRRVRRSRPARRRGDAQARARAASGGLPMKTLVSWSSGKDSAWMVHMLRQRGDVEIGALLTTINEPAQRVAMHAVRVEVLRAQADGARLAAVDGADSVAVPERGLRSGDARRRSRARSPKASRTSRSAICFSRTSAGTARSASPAAA